MGLINPDTYTTKAGVEKTGTYLSFAHETIFVQKESETVYNLFGNYRVYWNKDTRLAEKPFLVTEQVQCTLSEADLSTMNPYMCLYDALRLKYTNAIDDI